MAHFTATIYNAIKVRPALQHYMSSQQCAHQC